MPRKNILYLACLEGVARFQRLRQESTQHYVLLLKVNRWDPGDYGRNSLARGRIWVVRGPRLR